MVLKDVASRLIDVSLSQNLKALLPIEVSVDGSFTVVSAEQLKNADDGISVMAVFCKLMLARLEQPLKQESPIEISVFGKLMLARLEQPLKQESPIEISVIGKLMVLRPLQSWKQLARRFFISVSFRSTNSRDVQPLNGWFIPVTVEGSVTLTSEVQFLKASI